jgi:hypothetical protein
MIKRKLLILILFLLGASPLSGATWTHVNGTSNANYTPSASYTFTLGWTPSAGDLLLVACGVKLPGITISVTDNASGPADSYTAVSSAEPYFNGQNTAQLFATNVTAGTAPTSVTCHASSGSNYWQVVADEYSGAANPFVQDGSAAYYYGNSSNPSTSLTTGSTAGDLLWSTMFTDVTLTSLTVASPFSIRQNTLWTNYSQSSADDGVPSGVAASTQQTASWTANTAAWAIVFIVAIKAATAAPAVLLPASLSFGNMTVGFTSTALTATLTNTGGGNVTVSSVAISGTNSSDFTKTADTCNGQTVTPTNSCTVSVKFSPSAAGTRSASLVFTDNASNSPQSVNLSGTGIAGSHTYTSIL